MDATKSALYRTYQRAVNSLKNDSDLKKQKMQLRQVDENQNRFEINLAVTSSCEVTMSLHEVRGQFWGMCDLQLQFDL